MAKVVAIVGGVEDVRVGEDVGVGLELLEDGLDQLVNRLQSTEAVAVVAVEVVDLVIIQLGNGLEVVDITGL